MVQQRGEKTGGSPDQGPEGTADREFLPSADHPGRGRPPSSGCEAGTLLFATRSSAPVPPDWVQQELLEVNPFSRPGTKLEDVTGVVVHYVGNPGTTAGQNRSFFAGLAAQTPVEEGQPDPNTYASSHFLIGLDGEIIQCIPLDEWSYCTSQRNRDTILHRVLSPG